MAGSTSTSLLGLPFRGLGEMLSTAAIMSGVRVWSLECSSKSPLQLQLRHFLQNIHFLLFFSVHVIFTSQNDIFPKRVIVFFFKVINFRWRKWTQHITTPPPNISGCCTWKYSHQPKMDPSTTNLWVQIVSFLGCTLQGNESHPTKRGKGKLSSKVPWDKDMFVSRKVFPKGRWSFLVMNPYGKEFEKHQRTNIIPWIVYQSNICVTIQIYLWSKINNHQVIFGSYFCNTSTTHLKDNPASNTYFQANLCWNLRDQNISPINLWESNLSDQPGIWKKWSYPMWTKPKSDTFHWILLI